MELNKGIDMRSARAVYLIRNVILRQSHDIAAETGKTEN